MPAPRSFNQHIFFDAKGVYYGTDDGFQDDSFAEFAQFEALYAAAPAWRREQLHFVGAVGGLYSLNLMTCWQPTRITFFDINPHAIAYLRLLRRVIQTSANKQDFLNRLSQGDFDVEDDAEATIRENLVLKQRDALLPTRGSSYKRSLERSWQYALDHFELTKRLLTEVPLELRTESISSPAFEELLRTSENLWMYFSNIAEFTYARLRIDHPSNCVVTGIIYPGQVDILDLSPFGDTPVALDYEIPMTARRVDELSIPVEVPTRAGDVVGKALAAHCRAAGLRSDTRILDVGCGWGRLAIELLDDLDGAGEYEGFDPDKQLVRWAKENIMATHPRFTFHTANLRNPSYNPSGTLRPAEFKFPYADGERVGFDLVVMHALSQYLAPDELAHYLDESARVLKPGGKLLASFRLLDATGGRDVFRFVDGPLARTAPRGAGLTAWREDHVHERLAAAGLVLSSITPGSWRTDQGDLADDIIIATKP